MVKHEELTGEIIGACFDVVNGLGHGFVESVYERALVIALEKRGLAVERQVALDVWFEGQVVGEFIADIVVNGLILIELKAVSALQPEHQAQVINYLNATGMDVGLLVNFWRPRLDIRRCERRNGQTTWSKARLP